MSALYSVRTRVGEGGGAGGALHVVGEASLTDARDRSAPSDFHWKILKCRMLIFSERSLLAAPDCREMNQVHVVFGRSATDYERLVGLFAKFGLMQKGELKEATCEVLQLCLQYSLAARLAPAWNALGKSYLVGGRDFLTASGSQQAVECSVYVTEEWIDFHLKAMKITLMRSDYPKICDWVRVLPSLNKAIVEDYQDTLPSTGNFKCYKDMKRHWKNIHGYRLPEQEASYYSVRFWRGEPLTYPSLCVTSNWPIVVPVPRLEEKIIISKFLEHTKTKMGFIINEPINFIQCEDDRNLLEAKPKLPMETCLDETQAVSLCTPTQRYKTDKENEAPSGNTSKKRKIK